MGTATIFSHPFSFLVDPVVLLVIHAQVFSRRKGNEEKGTVLEEKGTKKRGRFYFTFLGRPLFKRVLLISNLSSICFINCLVPKNSWLNIALFMPLSSSNIKH